MKKGIFCKNYNVDDYAAYGWEEEDEYNTYKRNYIEREFSNYDNFDESCFSFRAPQFA